MSTTDLLVACVHGRDIGCAGSRATSLTHGRNTKMQHGLPGTVGAALAANRPIGSRASSLLRRRETNTQYGFTLIELVVVLVLIGALAAVSAVFLVQPFQAAEDLERRAALVDAADLALSRMVREARGALPNSVRVHSAGHVEFITVRTGGRYRRLPAADGSGDTFVPARTSDTFDVLGGLLGGPAVIATGSGGIDCATGGADCLSVYNTGQAGFNAYAGENLAGITAAAADSLGYDNGGATSPAFSAHSPQQRFHVIDSVVSYVCEGGELRRHAGYGLATTAPAFGAGAGALVAADIAGCDFRYDPGTAQRRGLLTLRIDLSRDGESVFLLAQAQVVNSP